MSARSFPWQRKWSLAFLVGMLLASCAPETRDGAGGGVAPEDDPIGAITDDLMNPGGDGGDAGGGAVDDGTGGGGDDPPPSNDDDDPVVIDDPGDGGDDDDVAVSTGTPLDLTNAIYADEVAPYWNADDATACLQNAIDQARAGEVVVVRDMGSPWLVSAQIDLKDDIGLQFLGNCTLQAIPGALENGQHLLNAQYRNNVVVAGPYFSGTPTAWLRIPPDAIEGEHRHAMLITSATNVHVSNLGFTSSGGDGVYVGGTSNIAVVDCVMADNDRCGLAITGGADILIARCRITNTRSQGGVLVEANEPWPGFPPAAIRRVTLRDCVSAYNQMHGFTVNITAMTADGEIDITFENCEMYGNATSGQGADIQLIRTIGQSTSPPGTIRFINCHSHDSEALGLRLYWPADGTPALHHTNVVFDGCSWENSRSGDPTLGPLVFRELDSTAGVPGQVQFINNCTILDSNPRQPIHFIFSTLPCSYVFGDLHFVNSSARTQEPAGALPNLTFHYE